MGGACSRTTQDDEQELVVRLQLGLSGGFSGTDPDEVHTITKATHSSSLIVHSFTRKSPYQPTPSHPSLKHIPINAHHSRPARLLAELRLVLSQLPVEMPKGSEDIYGEDISISWQSEDFEWCNSGPDGCGNGEKSRLQVTEKQKEKFRRAVDIVHELVESTM